MVTSSSNRSSLNGSNSLVINGINELDVSGYSSSEAGDLNDDNIINYRESTTKTYNAQGLLLSTVFERDWEGDGIIDQRESTTNTYDETGSLLSTVYEYDWGADGIIDSRDSTTNTYDPMGLLLSTVEEHDGKVWGFFGDNPDGIIDYRESTTNTYDETGLLLSTVDERDGNVWVGGGVADGIIDKRYSTTNTYNASGLLLSTVTVEGIIDLDNDGIADDLETQAGDRNQDGIPDVEQANVVSLPKLNGTPENPNDFFTLIAAEGIRFTNVKKVTDNPAPDAQDAPDAAEFQFPIGFLDFDIEGFEPGEEVTIGLLLPAGVTANTYWLYDADDRVWSDFLYDGETGAQFFDLVDQNGNFGQDGNADLVLLNFVDGGRGDKDGTANGRIEEPGAPGVASPTVVNSQRLVTTDGGVWEIQGSGAAAAPVQFTFNSSEADFVNEVGVFLVDEENRVNGIAPNDPRYAQEALAHGIRIFSGLPDEEIVTGLNLSRLLQASPGDRMAFYLVSNGTTDTLLGATGTPNVFFSIPEANPDGVDHLRVSESNDQFILAWEDWEQSEKVGFVQSDR